MNLIKRAISICNTNNIDCEDVYAIFNIYSYIGDHQYLYGTVLKYEKGDAKVIYISLESGWYKQYSFRSEKVDSIRIIRDLERNSFTRRQISDIMGISRDELDTLTTYRKE